MARLSHGSQLLLDEETFDTEHVPAPDPNQVACPEYTRFAYLFPDLQGPSKTLPENSDTVQHLIALGGTMNDPDPLNSNFDSTIPSIYTYLGQFITHDISLEGVTQKHLGKGMTPLPPKVIQKTVKNTRSAKLDLDSVYGPIITQHGCYPVPRTGDELTVARAIDDKRDGTDLVREPKPDYAARIGDSRNDELLTLSQLHLAFVNAHNAIVRRGNTFSEAQRLLRYHYQWIVVHDYLEQLTDTEFLPKILDGTFQVFPGNDAPFMPLEFSVAAFRFGHSMIRSVYNYNSNFKRAFLDQLILPKALGGYYKLLGEWVIDWGRFVQGGANVARRIDTRLVDPLARLVDSEGKPLGGLASLDLLRGYHLRLPTGQAVAERLNLTADQLMTEARFNAVTSDQQKEILKQSGFLERTPLWFYILAEAASFQEGQRLGPVGTRLVAGVLIGLLHADEDSYMHANFTPSLGNNGEFQVTDLLKLAGALT